MDYDTDKVDDLVLALLALTAFRDGPVTRAWKGHDWNVLDRLHQAGWIGNPRGPAKSVVFTPEGYARAEALFEQHFGRAAR